MEASAMKRRTLLSAAISGAGLALVPLRTVFAQALPAVRSDGKETTLSAAQLNDFQRGLKGAVVRPDSPGFDELRRVWNAEWDRRPALIVRCANVDDVIRAVGFAREHTLLTAVRAGGHSMTGHSVCDGGIVINISAINAVSVDPAAKTATVGGGALLGQLDAATQPHRLATTAGVVSHTGVGGLALGGGMGRLMRKFGLTVDNMLGVEMVRADGRVVTASADQNADLFWGVRGGGGNFGIVTAFKFRLHDFDGVVKNFRYLYPFEKAKDLLDFYIAFSENADRDLYTNATISRTPGGRMSARLSGSFFGSDAALNRIINEIARFGPPASTASEVTDYVAVQRSIDDQNRHGMHHYAKAGFTGTRDTALIGPLLESFAAGPPRLSFASLIPMDGAVGEVASDATAYPHRDAVFNLDTAVSWMAPTDSAAMVNAGREFWKPIEPFVANGFYVNSLMDEKPSAVQANFKGNYPRLVELKTKYDPTNFFRLNANIVPKA
jgi:hypothetical protein